MALIIYGLKTCDTCRKALKYLKEKDIAHEFRDIRQSPPKAGELRAWLDTDVALLNRKSRTWKDLTPTERERAETPDGCVTLLLAHPALIKRPLIQSDGGISVGWTADIQAGLA